VLPASDKRHSRRCWLGALPVCVDAAATMSGAPEDADRCWTSTRESVRKRSAAPYWLGHSAGSYRL
jgi:hypothetical protein